MIINMDCLLGMRLCLPDNCFDAIVTDPPYELGFMGKSWDSTGIANSVEMWREALRVLKPGGHLLAFSGSRTYHRMTCAIEDAGFEVRDQIFWVYASGFPKSHNLDNHRGKSICGCSTGTLPYAHENTEQKAERGVHPVCGADVSPPVDSSEGRREILQPRLPEQSTSPTGWAELPGAEVGGGQPCMEGRGDDVQEEGQLQRHSVHASAGMAAPDGAKGRLHHGAPGRDGGMVRLPVDANGSGSPHRPRPDEQPARQSGTVAGQSQPQTGGAWPVCAGCGLPVVPQGLGTALKPSHEPIAVARKPLAKGLTVAANVLAHGTGALNIDGCRVATDENRDRAGSGGKGGNGVYGESVTYESVGSPLGRWPANLIHDGSDEVLAAFPETTSEGHTPAARGAGGISTNGHAGQDDVVERRFGTGRRAEDKSAARFFYCAKASRSERNIGCDDMEKRPLNWSSGTQNPGSFQSEGTDKSAQNNHPTVKPLALMQYLVRLVAPPGGRVLDPFTGSGSTWAACKREGFDFVGFELDPHYCEIATRRAEAA